MKTICAMKLSPLQLKHYHFTEFSVSAITGVSPSALTSEDSPYPPNDALSLETEVLMGSEEGTDDPHLFVIRLTITGCPKDGEVYPYKFKIHVEGVFEMKHDGDISLRNRLVVVNGTGVLFGAAREQLLLTTGRCVHGAILLPTLDFRGLARDEESPPIVQPGDTPQGRRQAPRKRTTKTIE